MKRTTAYKCEGCRFGPCVIYEYPDVKLDKRPDKCMQIVLKKDFDPCKWEHISAHIDDDGRPLS